MTLDKGKSKQYYFFKSLKFIKPYKGWAFVSVLSCLITAVISIMCPIYTEKTLTAFTSANGHDLIVNGALLLLFQLLISVIHMLLWGTSADRLKARVTKDIRYNILDSILKLKTENFDLYGSGYLIQVVSSDTTALSGIYTNMVDVFLSLLSKIAVYIYIFSANYILGFYCIFEFLVICFV